MQKLYPAPLYRANASATGSTVSVTPYYDLTVGGSPRLAFFAWLQSISWSLLLEKPLMSLPRYLCHSYYITNTHNGRQIVGSFLFHRLFRSLQLFLLFFFPFSTWCFDLVSFIGSFFLASFLNFNLRNSQSSWFN